MNDIIVFLGPSLSIKAAKKWLPDALYLPPAQCGDLLRVIRLRPKIIALIDGAFEHQAAVWHKEILYALEKNIMVLGSSSMGALRAAELHKYGMIGIGKIYQQFKSKQLIDDDEVAILHGPSQSQYQALTDAMVNIRATITTAAKHKIISPQLAKTIINTAKALNYRERNLNRILENIEPANNKKLQAWLKQNFIDLKQEDAILLLKTIHHEQECNLFDFTKINFNMPYSQFFLALYRRIMCQPFPFFNEGLPPIEKILFKIAKHNQLYLPLQHLALLLSALSELREKNLMLRSKKNDDPFKLESIRTDNHWYKLNDCTAYDKLKFLQRMRILQTAIDSTNLAKGLIFFFRLMGIFNLYEKSFSKNACSKLLKLYEQQQPESFRIIALAGICWQRIYSYLRKQNYSLKTTAVAAFKFQFEQQRNLRGKDLNAWQKFNFLNTRSYHNFIIELYYFKHFILDHHICSLNTYQKGNNDHFWLLDAARLAGIYSSFKSS